MDTHPLKQASAGRRRPRRLRPRLRRPRPRYGHLPGRPRPPASNVNSNFAVLGRPCPRPILSLEVLVLGCPLGRQGRGPSCPSDPWSLRDPY